MFKLAKIGIAAMFGLTLILSAFGSGAFARSVNQNSAHGISQPAAGLDQDPRTGSNWQGNRWNDGSNWQRDRWNTGSGWQGNRWNKGSDWQGNRWNDGSGWQGNRWPVDHNRCVPVVKWIKSWHTFPRRVVYWFCRRR